MVVAVCLVSPSRASFTIKITESNVGSAIQSLSEFNIGIPLTGGGPQHPTPQPLTPPTKSTNLRTLLSLISCKIKLQPESTKLNGLI